jgi:hypothetical protein
VILIDKESILANLEDYMTKTKNTLYAINTRIPLDLAEKMNNHLAITKKSASAFIMDAIIEYMNLIYDKEHKPTKALQIDRFAAEIERNH